MADILLLEEWDADVVFDLADSRTIISLTPEASYYLKKAEVEYNIPEGYYLWDGRKDKLAFDSWFTEFRGRIDGVALGIFHELENLPYSISTACIVMLRNMLYTFRIKSNQFKAILEAEKPKRIKFIGRGGVDNFEPELMFLQGPSLYNRMCYHWSYDIEVDVREIEQGEKEDWRDNKTIRRVYDYFRTFKCFPLLFGNNGIVWFANVIPHYMRMSKLRGYKVKLVPKLEPIDFNILDVNSRYVETDTLIDEISSEFNVPLEATSFIFGPRLNYFFCNIVPQVYAMAEGYKRFFQILKKESEEEVIVLFNNITDSALIGMLYGTVMAGVKTMFLDHGWDAYDLFETRYYEKMMPFTYYIPFTKEADEYYKLKRKEN